MNWSRRRVLVTGGASFIGSYLVEKLVAKGASVKVVDNLSSGSKDNLSNVYDQIEFVQGDLKDRGFALDTIKGTDVLFHLAASHGGRGYIATHPADCASNMVLDGIVFDAAHQAAVERTCFASSACVYPKNLQSADKNRGTHKILLAENMADPFAESRAFADEEYGWAKLMGEMTLRAYHQQYGTKGVSCRIFTAYGPRENETHAVVALIAKAFAKMDPYSIWGTGEQDRNFTYVEDIADGMIRATERIDDTQPVNLGTARHLKIKDLARMIFELIGFTPQKIDYDISKPEGVYSRAADLTKSREDLEWEPKTELDEGLKRTIDWYFATHTKEHVAKNLETTLYER